MMRVLCVIPPQIPSYFNAGHHLPIFQVGAYIRNFPFVEEVICRDLSCLSTTWKDVCSLMLGGYDIIIVMNDFDGVDTFQRFVTYSRSLLPNARIGTFGRGSKQVPGFFERFGFDAIVESGDYEAGIGSWLSLLAEKKTTGNIQIPGVRVRKDSGEYLPALPGIFLPVSEWIWPDVRDIPYEDYDRLYRNDLNKFCGIPYRRELVIPVARGCPIGCSFCDVPSMQGRIERRVPVTDVIKYISLAQTISRFDYMSFYAPTFTLSRTWVMDLCAAFSNRILPWKCVTTIGHLDKDLVKTMGAAGCVRISVGVETLSPQASTALPSIKRDIEDRLWDLVHDCSIAGIELNVFVILGLPNDDPSSVGELIERLVQAGVRVRPTLYTPYHQMHSEMSEAEYGTFNRQLFVPGLQLPDMEMAWYRMFHANSSDRPTQIMDRILVESSPLSEPQLLSDLPYTFSRSLIQAEPWEPKFIRLGLNLSSNELLHPQVDKDLTKFLQTWPTLRGRIYSVPHSAIDVVASEACVAPEQILLTPGSDDAIRLIILTVALAGGRILGATPLYAGYERYATACGVHFTGIDWSEDGSSGQIRRLCQAVEHGIGLVIVADPDGFRGQCAPKKALFELARRCKACSALLLIDEAYIAFSDREHLSLLGAQTNVLLLRTFSKNLGMAGMRAAALYGHRDVIANLRRWRPTNGVSQLSMDLLSTRLGSESMNGIITDVRRWREELRLSLMEANALIASPPTETNFILIDAPKTELSLIEDRIRQAGIRIRRIESPGQAFLRLTVAPPAVSNLLLEAVRPSHLNPNISIRRETS